MSARAWLEWRDAWETQASGVCIWMRSPADSSRTPMALFSIGSMEPEVPACGNEDLSLLAQLRLIAGGTSPGDAVARPPFHIEHAVTTRVCVVGGHVLHAGEQAEIQSGDTIELGLLSMIFRSLPDVVPCDFEPCMADVEIADALTDGQERVHATGDPLLDELHGRYRALLMDPAALGEQSNLIGALALKAQSAQAPDPLAELADRTRGPDHDHDSLHDLLVAPGTMDALIARADVLGPQDLLQAPVAESVLHLFAPAANGSSQQRGAAALASLTRIEHHQPAADSALPSTARAISTPHPEAP